MVGDHLALDMLNTQARDQNGRAVDYWATGADVLRWPEQHGVVPASTEASTATAGEELLSQARALRDLARRLIVERAESGGVTGHGELNAYLHAYKSTPHLQRDVDGALVLSRTTCGQDTSSLLGPAAEAVAELLVEADFSLVKKCEHPECILWFYDRTRARRRRWCSMAVCGNRHKVDRFRRRAAAAKTALST